MIRKTTVALGVAAQLAARDVRVLLVDLDAQRRRRRSSASTSTMRARWPTSCSSRTAGLILSLDEIRAAWEHEAMRSEPCSARGGFESAAALTVAGIGMVFGAYLPWLSVYILLGSSATDFSPHEFASTSTEIWHLLFGSSSPHVATYAGAVGRIAIVCGVGVVAAAVLSGYIPVRYRIWASRLAMSLAIVAMLDCVLVIGVVSSNDSENAGAVSTSYGCYFTLFASLAAMIAAYLNSPVKAAREQSPGWVWRGRGRGL